MGTLTELPNFIALLPRSPLGSLPRGKDGEMEGDLSN